MKKNILLVVASLLLLVTGAGVVGCSDEDALTENQDDSSVSSQNGGISTILPADVMPPDGWNGDISSILSQQNTGIWVSGVGTVTVVPDVAVLTLGVEAQAITVAEAQEQAAVAMDAVMVELDGLGVAEKDIKTQYYNIYTERRWDNGEYTLTGYRVTNMVTVKIREVADTGAVIDAVVSAGGDYIRINSISFTVDDPSAYYDEARQEAMADAEAKAQQLADLAGVTLGKPTYISEGGGYIPVPYDRVMSGVAEAAAPETPISAGETEIRLTVQVVYSILN